MPLTNTESEDEENWEEVELEVDKDLVDVQIDKVPCKAPDPAMPIFPSENNEHKSVHSSFKWFVGFVFVLQAKYHLPNAAIDLLIKFIYTLVCALGSSCPFADKLRMLFPCSLYMMRKHNFPDVLSQSIQFVPNVTECIIPMMTVLKLLDL